MLGDFATGSVPDKLWSLAEPGDADLSSESSERTAIESPARLTVLPIESLDAWPESTDSIRTAFVDSFRAPNLLTTVLSLMNSSVLDLGGAATSSSSKSQSDKENRFCEFGFLEEAMVDRPEL